MTLSRYVHTGAAPATGLASGITSSATSFTVLDGTGYPSPAAGQYFVVCIDAGATSEEKILCSARSGTTFTVAGGGRGYDGTTAASHSSGTTNVTHVLSAAEVDDTSDHIYTTTRDDHTQYAKTDGTRAFTGGISVTGNSTITGTLTVTDGIVGNPAGRMYLSSDVTVASSVTDQLTPMTSSFVEGSVTVASNELTVPAAGDYLIVAAAQCSPGSSVSTQIETFVVKNGSTNVLSGFGFANVAGYAIGFCYSDIVSLAANDALTMSVFNGGSGSLTVHSGALASYLSVVKVSG